MTKQKLMPPSIFHLLKYYRQNKQTFILVTGFASLILFYYNRNKIIVKGEKLYYAITAIFMSHHLRIQKRLSLKMLNNVCKVLLIGTPGVGKTRLFAKITNQPIQIRENKKFQEFNLSAHYSIVDTPSIQLDESIEKREETINYYQEVLSSYGHLICNIFIVVNFERTDLMKKKISDVYKYFRKFDYLLGIIVTDFDKSENPEQDKINLQRAFQVYKLDEKKILFISFNEHQQVIREQIIRASQIERLEQNRQEFQE